MISSLYAAVARRRREWYAARPDARRRLRHPVISVGNIAAGGRGKTPFTATLARTLMELGERPAILSRGYARTRPEDGAVVVRDAREIRADLARAGDEPFMLARQLPGAIVISSSDRFVAGRLAEHHLGATVHLLDDGFQHFQLDRDIDIVLVAAADLDGVSTFPRGRLREPPDVLVAADAIIAIDDVPLRQGQAPVFRARRGTGPAVFESPSGAAESRDVLALAGIAEPRRFFEALPAGGWNVVATKVFPDHYAFSARDIVEIFAAARRAGAGAILTTEKDYVRLLPHRPFPVRVGWVPLTMEPEPAAEFRQWLVSSMASTRDIVLA
ncbi:MAG TPA: tetraacyldisaccharide 4'-kinase [Vicinamibacterales bacterium]|nr:tetraacyldisaccharide 4'-kinase [Vicinamibacterales bacterium]